jgi:quercetin dioxygenase-like cupin family protein
MHGEARIVALGPHDGVALADPVEGEVTFKARGLESGGALPSHVHDGQEEALYVLAGQLRVRLGERTYPCAAGGFLLIPRGTPHAIENACDAPARVLAVLAPASA